MVDSRPCRLPLVGWSSDIGLEDRPMSSGLGLGLQTLGRPTYCISSGANSHEEDRAHWLRPMELELGSDAIISLTW